ncbi:type VI secretion system protein VasD [Roseibium hamelinense]|uniref:Type VI secretion system protein VasD n=1 Tax=Roseibium hamelinense TaxID=150831 RepID=A0A562SE59_9HYPH|nr:type VI secretion system lipoprotein TssJ [Roseibium hamelinense]MTI42572.1 type VI secretion system lipoprotein TssJ [Roseibium hamelinense]TWI79549.1 type VI secretion system protein VasD [Roseibium hamelinense]
MKISRRDLCQGLLIAPAFGMAACSRVPEPTPVTVQLFADDNVNPNENGDPAPIVVRVYELKGMTAFNNGEFFEFADDDTKLLGGDLIGKQEYELTPGEKKDYDRSISSEATHIGVVAAFRDIQSAQWRDSIELEAEKKNEFVIYLTSLAVRIQKLRRRRLGVF